MSNRRKQTSGTKPASVPPIARPTAERVLSRYARSITHLRDRLAHRELGLVTGAGLSNPLGYPNWRDLLTRVASKVEAPPSIQRQSSHASRSQLLFQHFRLQLEASIQGSESRDVKTRAAWQRLVHDCLYEGAEVDPSEALKRHPYLQHLLHVVMASPLTINYNFDNLLERCLEHNSYTRRQFSTTSSNTFSRPAQGRPLIYHPNGYLPYGLKNKPSDNLVFLEDSFADQLIDSVAGRYAALSYHLATLTCLFVGLSLDDPTLKHLLRSNAKMYPGHYHYYIAYRDETTDEGYERAVADSNFEVFNLITLFMNSEDISALLELLASEEQQFSYAVSMLSAQGARKKFVFVIAGAVGAGKTTVCSHFRNCSTYPEWLEERADGMETDPANLGEDQIARIDAWVSQQMSQRNAIISDAVTGIHVADRGPLDPIAFADEQRQQSRAKELLDAFGTKVAGAHIVFLKGVPKVMELRAHALHKSVSAESLARQQERLLNLYRCDSSACVTVVDTTNMPIEAVVKSVANIIHRRTYDEAPLHDWLAEEANA